MITAAVLTLLAQASTGPSQEAMAREIAAVCRQVFCRPAGTMRLKRKNGKIFEMTASGPAPIVTGDLVTVMPGETVYVEARVEGRRLRDLTAVSRVSNPHRTLTLHFDQDRSTGDGTGMTLTIHNPFPGVLKYRLGMMLLDHDAVLATSSCPVRAGNTNFEHWPDPIFQLVATDFRLEEPSSKGAVACE